MRMMTSAPARKVTAGALVSAITTLLVWWIKSANPELNIPGGVEAAVTTILTFVGGYLTPPARQDQPIDPLVPSLDAAPARGQSPTSAEQLAQQGS